MSVPLSVATILKDHVTLEVESIDRMYLNVYVPRLQSEQGVASFFRFHRGYAFASSALMDPLLVLPLIAPLAADVISAKGATM